MINCSALAPADAPADARRAAPAAAPGDAPAIAPVLRSAPAPAPALSMINCSEGETTTMINNDPAPENVDPVLMTEDQDQDDAPLWILAHRLPEAQAKIDKANARLARAGISERFQLLASAPFTHEYRDGMGFAHQERRVYVALESPSIGYQGWTFVATLAFEEGGTVVRTVPGQSCDYRPVSKECDQCHTVRERNETFVVRNDSTGEFRQVGRNCLALFFGLKPTLWTFSWDPELDTLQREPSAGSTGGYFRKMLTAQIVGAALAVSDMGRAYVPASFYDKETTKDKVSAVLSTFTPERDPERAGWLREMRRTAAALYEDGTAAQVIDYVKTIKGSSEYAENARVLAASEWVDYKNLGIVASFAKVWANEQTRAAERKAEEQAKSERVNEWAGAVGDKLQVTGVVSKLREIEGQYGTSLLVEVIGEDGRTYKTFSTSRWVWDLEEGQAVKFAGTVKALDEFKGYRSTVLTRTKAL